MLNHHEHTHTIICFLPFQSIRTAQYSSLHAFLILSLTVSTIIDTGLEERATSEKLFERRVFLDRTSDFGLSLNTCIPIHEIVTWMS